MNSRFSTYIGILFLKLISIFPFWLIYLISDIFFVIVYYVIGYRKNVVITNLKNSFPEKTAEEIKHISKKYFRHFADLTLETIKMHGMHRRDFEKRMIVTNAGIVNHFFEQGKSAMVLTMHYNNWEWGTYLTVHMKHKVLAVYKPLHNEVFDRYMNANRSMFGTELVRNDHILKRILLADRRNEPVFTWLAGDQTPPLYHKTWYRFLNQETLFYQGPALMSKQFNQPLFFQNIEKTGRGKYKTTFELLFENPAEYSDTEIMNKYIRRMEEIIRENPGFYIWSHKRWKHKRPENLPVLN